MKTQREIEREMVTSDAEYDVDTMAALVAADMAEEEGDVVAQNQADGLPEAFIPKRGDWVVIFTGAFFHCGQLLGVDHEQYCLNAGAVTIDETGSFKQFFGDGRCTYGEPVPTRSVVRKGPTTQVAEWPHGKTCGVVNAES